MIKKKKITIIISIILFIIIFIIIGLYIRNIKLSRAEYGDKLEFDGKVYEEISYKEIEPYNETWKVVCKTTDGVWTIYEIEQYPEHEYLVARTSWEARVLKRIN